MTVQQPLTSTQMFLQGYAKNYLSDQSVLIIGTVGVGKSRLGLEIVSQYCDANLNAVGYCNVDPLQNHSDVLSWLRDTYQTISGRSKSIVFLDDTTCVLNHMPKEQREEALQILKDMKALGNVKLLITSHSDTNYDLKHLHGIHDSIALIGNCAD